MNNGKSGLLYGKKAIKDYLRVGDDRLREFVDAGMPVRINKGSWVAHADNLEEFFKSYTRVNSRGKAE